MNGQDLVTATLITTLLGLIVPPVVSFLRGVHTPVQWIGAINLAICLLAAGVALWLQRTILEHPPTDTRGTAIYYLGDLVLVFNQARVYYAQVYKTLLADLTDTLERKGPDPAPKPKRPRHVPPAS